MITKRNILIAGILLLIIAALALLYFSTKTEPYTEYSPAFQQRGSRLEKEEFPKNASDSLFAIQMEQLQFKDETRNELNENKINWTGVIASTCLLIGAFVSILGLFFNNMNKRRSNDILELKAVVTSNHMETKQLLFINNTQHSVFEKMLLVVEDITIRKSISESFRAIARNYMHYQKGSIPDNLQTLITSQAERLIELSDQIMTEHFSIDIYDVAMVKIEEQNKIAWRQAGELFGNDFLTFYKCAQSKAVKDFKERLNDIVKDSEFNGKYDRYKRASEYFLDELIRLTIAEYKNFKKAGK